MNSIKAYAYITKKLYDKVLKEGRVFPKLGVNCNATWNGVYKAFERRYNKQVFFAWDTPTETDWTDEKGEYVYVELELPIEIIKRTDYLNWCDLISIYKDREKDPSKEELLDILEEIGFNDNTRTLDELWEDIYATDIGNIQIMYDYLDKSFIKKSTTKRKPIITY